MRCNCCGETAEAKEFTGRNGHKVILVDVCPACNAVQGRVFAGEVSNVVPGLRPFVWFKGKDADAIYRYFDLTILESGQENRVHGWYDQRTGLIIQVG